MMRERENDIAQEYETKAKKIVCAVCKTRHFYDLDTFFTFHGNVTIGLRGGVIGNNFDEEGNLNRLTFICRDGKCLNEILLKNQNDGLRV